MYKQVSIVSSAIKALILMFLWSGAIFASADVSIQSLQNSLEVALQAPGPVRLVVTDIRGKVIYDHQAEVQGASALLPPLRVPGQLVFWRLESQGRFWTGKSYSGHFAVSINESSDAVSSPLLKTAVPPSPAYDIRLVAVVTASDGSSGHTTNIYNATFSRDSVIKTMNDIKQSWTQTGINFLFNPKTDIVEVKKSILNEEAPIVAGNLVLPPPPGGVDDFTGNANIIAQRSFADNLGKVVVIYFKDHNTSWTQYTDAAGNAQNVVPAGAWSGIHHKYVRFAKNLTLMGQAAQWPLLASHELGHYFNLSHTHGPMLHNTAEMRDSIRSKVAQGAYTKGNVRNYFDGDGLSDTPFDPGEWVIGSLNTGGNKCGPVGSFNLFVNYPGTDDRTYAFNPNRDNLMSYYIECQDPATAEFSAQQVTRIRASVETGVRNPLISPAPERVTAVFRKNTANERQSLGWAYTPTRFQYDNLWNEGWRLRRLRTHYLDGQPVYSATWRKSTSGEYQYYNTTYSKFRTWYDAKWNQNYRLSSLSINVVNGAARYTAVVKPSTSAEFQIYGATYAQYRAWYDQKWKEGYRLHILEPYVLNGTVLYTAVVRPSTAAEYQYYGPTYSNYRSWYDTKWNEGYRLHSLKVLRVNGTPRYYAVVKKSTASEKQYYNYTWEDFRKKYDALSNGWTLHSLSVY